MYRHSLRQALATVGFRELRDLPNPSPCASMFAASYAMKNGQSPQQAIVVPMRLKLYAFVAANLGVLLPARREFLTMSAYRSKK